MVKLHGCDCEWEKDTNATVGEGYSLVTMCDECKAIQVKSQQAETARNTEREKTRMIKEKLREMAIAKLQEEGKWP